MKRIALLVVVVGVACGGGGGGGAIASPPPGNPPPGNPPPGNPPPGNPPPGGGTTPPPSIQVGGLQFAAVGGQATCRGATSGKGSVAPQYGLAYADLIALDQPGICGDLQSNQQKANARTVTIKVIRIDRSSSTTTLTTGSYPIVSQATNDTAYATLIVAQTDATCNATYFVAASGTVDVTSVANGQIQGSVDATLAGGQTVTGAFDAAPCAVTFPGNACTGTIGPQNMTCVP